MPGGTCGLFPSLEEHRKNNPPTNADRVRAMSDEELAATLLRGCPPEGRIINNCLNRKGEINCIGCWLGWLKSPAEG